MKVRNVIAAGFMSVAVILGSAGVAQAKPETPSVPNVVGKSEASARSTVNGVEGLSFYVSDRRGGTLNGPNCKVVSQRTQKLGGTVRDRDWVFGVVEGSGSTDKKWHWAVREFSKVKVTVQVDCNR